MILLPTATCMQKFFFFGQHPR
ncbi:hypothetical protein NC652_005887 [Populus alba x Populus x berolinensis]|nr:hypothetical protein NC652_005887 [Populus alba x Populus x berolinensis]